MSASAAKASSWKSKCKKPAPTTAAGWAQAFASLGGKWAIADQGSSIRLPDGRSLWVFDDTVQGRLVGKQVHNWRMAHNSIVIADRGCLSVHTGRNSTSLLPDSGKDYYWPTSVTMDGNRLFVFTQRVRTVGKNAMDFQVLGTRLAELSYAPGKTPRFLRWHSTPGPQVSPLQGPQWGAAATASDGYTYVYATQQSTEYLVFGKALYVARAPKGKLTSLSAWTYWDGASWNASRSSAVQIKAANGGVSNSLSMQKVGDRWVGVTKKDDYLGDKIVVLTAASPTGPFTETVVATTRTQADLAKGDMTYTALGHPELSLKSGKLLITVCRNNTELTKWTSNISRGRPYFLEVPLPKN